MHQPRYTTIRRLKDKMNTYTDINAVLKREVEEVQCLRSENELFKEELRKNRRQMQTYRGLQVVIDGLWRFVLMLFNDDDEAASVVIIKL